MSDVLVETLVSNCFAVIVGTTPPGPNREKTDNLFVNIFHSRNCVQYHTSVKATTHATYICMERFDTCIQHTSYIVH